MLISFKEMLNGAKSNGYAVGYFETWDIYSLEAVVEAAEATNTPTIIGFGESVTDYNWFDTGGLEKLAALGLTAAKLSKVPMVLIFNEVSTIEHAIRGVKFGYNAVMLDSARLPLAKHIELTKKLVKEAHAVGAGVEAELGLIPMAGQDESITKGSFTNIQEAQKFIEETNIDALAVSIGNVHVMKNSSAKINIDLLKEIHEEVNVPLVVHGGTGLPDEIIPELIKNGVAKINVGTILKRLFFETIRDEIKSITTDNSFNIHDVIGSRKHADIINQGKLRIREEVIRRIKIYNFH